MSSLLESPLLISHFIIKIVFHWLAFYPLFELIHLLYNVTRRPLLPGQSCVPLSFSNVKYFKKLDEMSTTVALIVLVRRTHHGAPFTIGLENVLNVWIFVTDSWIQIHFLITWWECIWTSAQEKKNLSIRAALRVRWDFRTVYDQATGEVAIMWKRTGMWHFVASISRASGQLLS